MRVLIVGGGAAGLAAAVEAARAGAQVQILEKNDRVGKKLLATGNGRCNLTNLAVAPEGYNCPSFVAPVLDAVSCAGLRDFFMELGLWTYADEAGRVYPVSDAANSVLDVLRLGCAELGVREVCGFEVREVRREKDGYRVRSKAGEGLFGHRLIVTTGGGSALLGDLGHTLLPFEPVLCPLETETAGIRGLSGLRVRCEAALLSGGETVACERGEMLFRDFGVSGIAVFDLSRFYRSGMSLRLDLMPQTGEAALAALFRERLARQGAREPEAFFTGIFHKRLGRVLMERTGALEAARLAAAVKRFDLKVLGKGDVTKAQVTRGGAHVGEFSARTLESMGRDGLFAAGESLDVDGRCGGYNLHWAFVSGIVAGRAAGGTADD